jgi:c-di-GMP-binding flagellar brake protein YcgR
VVGHVYLYTTVFGSELISVDQAHQINLLTQLLNYAMSKTAIARTFYSHAPTRVVNISLGGMLFELNNQVLFDYLTFHDKLRMVLQIRYHLLHLEGEITRYFPTKNGYNIGFRFFKADPDSYKVLEQFIYDRSRLTFA